MAFVKAVKQVASAKIGAFGPMGSGKTTLMGMLALYLSKTYHKSAPVAFTDSEKGSDFLIPFFEIEGVPLLVDKTRAFVDLRNAHAEAMKAGACAVVTDSLTHFWQELLRVVKGDSARLDIKKIGEAKERWAQFTENYETSPIHWLVAGRLGNDWDNVDIEDERTGEIKTELMKGGTKMKAEGDFSYEPDLVVELSSADDPNAADYQKLRKGGRVKKLASKQIHIAQVKKCRVRELNGQMFSWPDKPYKQGDYIKVAECFKSYFEFLNIGGPHTAFDASRTSQEIVLPSRRDEWSQKQRRKELALDEIKGNMARMFNAGTGNEAKFKVEILEQIFGYTSFTALEKMTADELEYGLNVCKRIIRFCIATPPADRNQLLVHVENAKKEVKDEAANPPRDEARESGRSASIEQMVVGMPQPIVKQLEITNEDVPF